MIIQNIQRGHAALWPYGWFRRFTIVGMRCAFPTYGLCSTRVMKRSKVSAVGIDTLRRCDAGTAEV